MAITTLAGVISGLQPIQPIIKFTSGTAKAAGLPQSLWYATGMPAAGAAPSSGVNGSAHTSPVVGQIARTDPPSGNAYLGRFGISVDRNVPCTILLCDRLWSNSGLSATLTTSQAITPAALPARDNNGSTNGEGVLAAIEWSANGGAGTPALTLTYTNQAGTAGKSATRTTVASPNAGTFEIFSLAAGDTGIRAPTAYQATSTRTSGTFHLILFRILAVLPVDRSFGNAIDAPMAGMPLIYNGSVPFLLHIPNATGSAPVNYSGYYAETQG